MHKILFYNRFIICLYMFRAICAHHQEVKIVLYSIWCHHTCRWPSGAQVEVILNLLSLTVTTAFSMLKFYVLPTQRIYVFCVYLRTNNDYFPMQR